MAPAKGPLHNALEKALTDTQKTGSALNQALSSGAIPGTSAIHPALHSDTALQGALNKALHSAQVPSHGPLHDAAPPGSALGSDNVPHLLVDELAGETGHASQDDIDALFD